MTASLLIYAFIVAALTLAEWRRAAGLQSILKPLAAFGFIVLALQSGALDSAYGQIILMALIACALGDVLLLSRNSQKIFLSGIAAFAIGHILYSVGFIRSGLLQGSGIAIALFMALSAAAISLTLLPRIDSDMRRPAYVYTGIIITMVFLAIMTRNSFVIGGAVLFATSDYFVGRDRFITRADWHPFAITPLYFGAQALFALSAAQAL